MRYAWLLLLGAVAALTGCKYDIVDCSNDQQRYIDETLIWMSTHSDEMTAEMDAVWNDRTVEYGHILGKVSVAEIQCGEGNNGDDSVPASRIGGRIVIDVLDDEVQRGLDLFLESEWIAEYTLEELADPTVVDYGEISDPMGALYQQLRSLGEMAYILNHEGAHYLFGQHSHETRRELDRLEETSTTENSGLDYEDTAQLDETYSWGFAAIALVDSIYTAEHERFTTLVNSR